MTSFSRLCVSSWAFHEQFESGELRLLDFPEMVADTFHVHTLEVVSYHFLNTDPAALQKRLRGVKSGIANVPVDLWELWEKPSLSSPDPAVRKRAVALYSAWIDRAASMKISSVRCDPGLLNLDDLTPTIESYSALVAYGASKKVEVCVENHGSSAKYPGALAEVLRQSGAAALPDIGNFANDQARERGLRLLFPLAKSICHVKDIPTLRQCIGIAEAVKFRGVYSIESGDVQDMINILLTRE
jgi:hypothetical protein